MSQNNILKLNSIFIYYRDFLYKMICGKIIEKIYNYVNLRTVYSLVLVCKKYKELLYKISLASLLAKCENRGEKLNVFLDFWRELPEQGSEAWILGRVGVVGGSEIHKLIKSRHEDGPRELLESKLGLRKFNGNSDTRWGNVFENMSSILIDVLIGGVSREVGSIPGLKNHNGETIQSYSADRLLHIRGQNLLNLIKADFNIGTLGEEEENYIKKLDDLIVLVEFKNPTKTIPSDKIPEHYVPQPYTGLCTIPIADVGLFVNCMFRRCALDDFECNNLYNDDMHHGREEIPTLREPLFMGFMAVYFVGASNETQMENSWVSAVPLMIKEIEKEIGLVHSVFHNLGKGDFDIPAWILMCCKFIGKYKLFEDGEIKLIAAVLTHFSFTVLREQIMRYYNMFNDYKEQVMDYGKDFGDFNVSTQEFGSMLTKVTDRTSGYKIYYAKEFVSASDINWPNVPSLATKQGYQVWMKKQINKFGTFCHKSLYKPIGIIPWKLFRISMIPVVPRPNYLSPHISKITRFTNLLKNIHQRTTDLNGEEKSKAIREAVESHYARPAGGPAEEKIKLSPETLNEFNDL
jgi:hypothetical protein